MNLELQTTNSELNNPELRRTTNLELRTPHYELRTTHYAPKNQKETDPGGHSEGETPVPIPNTEVKPFSADGTATARWWESRSPPGSFFVDDCEKMHNQIEEMISMFFINLLLVVATIYSWV